jgi:hypothetical protein
MTTLGKFVVRVGLLSILSVLPLAAQVDDGVDFKAPFPFYAGSAKLPAGSYRITQPDMYPGILRIESTDGKASAFVKFIPTETLEPHRKSAVTFRRNGKAEYLDRAWSAGETNGIMIDPTRFKVTVAANATVADPSAVSSGQ